MSTFWSLYVAVLTLGTIIAMLWLLLSTRKVSPTNRQMRPSAMRSTALRSTTTHYPDGGSIYS